MVEFSAGEVEAIREYPLKSWQIEETKKALSEAESGEFASNAEVRQVVRKWTRPAR